jgi:hypothetical protein
MKYLCDACGRIVDVGSFSVEGDRLALSCPVCGGQSVSGAAAAPDPVPAPEPPRPPAAVLSIARPPKAPEGPLCPKCGAPRPPERDSCARCGLVFSRFNPENLALSPEIEALWAAVEASWGDEGRHEAFVEACTRAQVLTEAARRYRLAAERDPSDATAARRRDELVARLMALGLPGVGLQHAERAPRRAGPLAVGLATIAFAAAVAALLRYFGVGPGF